MDTVDVALSMLRHMSCPFCKALGKQTVWMHWAWHKPELLVARCKCGNYSEITAQVIPN